MTILIIKMKLYNIFIESLLCGIFAVFCGEVCMCRTALWIDVVLCRPIFLFLHIGLLGRASHPLQNEHLSSSLLSLQMNNF